MITNIITKQQLSINLFDQVLSNQDLNNVFTVLRSSISDNHLSNLCQESSCDR